MTQQPVEANVVLTADNAQYDQTMQASAGYTETLAQSVDSLTTKISDLTKSAGKKLMMVTAADVAAIGGATAAWAAYENQVSRLQAQSAILTKTRADETKQIETYTKAVNDLRKTFGTSTGEGVRLVENITKLTENKTQKDLGNIAKIFVDMSKATGESSEGLATSVLGLQKVMGTAITSESTRKYADQLTVLSQTTGMTASGLADFAAQIGPVGRLLEMNQTEVTGVAAAFAKAGQEGGTAANAFNQMVSDIAYATQSGSPKLNQYANLIGVTVGHFKEMEGSEKMIRIFEQLNSMGPRAVTELNRLGLDGMRTMRAITAMTQSGGLRSSIQDATASLNSNANAEGAAAAMQGMVDEWQKIREEIKLSAEAMATLFGPAITEALGGVEALASGFRKMLEGPLGEVAQVVMGLAGALTGAAGGLLTGAGPLAQVAAAALLWRGSGMMGIREGFRGGGRVGGPGALGETGQNIAARGSWFQRYMYNAGATMGGAAGRVIPQGSGAALGTRAGAGLLNTTAWGLRNLIAPIYSPMGVRGYQDPTRRTRLFNDQRSPWRQGWDRFGPGAGQQRAPGSGPASVSGSLFGPNLRIDDQGRVTSGAATAAAAAAASRNSALGREAGMLSRAFANLTRSAGTAAGALASAAVNAGMLAGRGAGWAANKVGYGNLALGGGLILAGSGAADSTGFSNTLSLGLMGGIAGVPGAAAGTAVGLYMDARSRGKGLDNAVDVYGEQDARGEGLAQRWSTIREADAAWEKTRDALTNVEEGVKGAGTVGGLFDFRVSNPLDTIRGYKSMAEGVFGESDLEEEKRKHDELTSAFRNEENALRGLADAMSIDVNKGDMITQLAELDKVYARAKPKMDELGITVDDLAKAYAAGGDELDSLIRKIVRSGETTGLWDRLESLNRSGDMFMSDPTVKQALMQPENVNAQYRAVNSQIGRSLAEGMSWRQIIRQRGNLMASTGDPGSSEYMLNQAILGRAQQAIGYQLPFMSRTQGYRTQAGLFTDQANLMAGDPEQEAQMDAAKSSFMAATVQQVQYFQQRLMQQRQFELSMSRAQIDYDIQRERMDEQYNISRERAQEDFHLQREYQEYDYQLGRRRAEFDFNLQRERGQEQFARSMRRSQTDFNLQRRRQEEDYQHQVRLMVEQSAQSLYNVYERIRVQRTSSADYLMVNAQDQLRVMQQQAENLDRVRAMGLSDDTIQQLGLGKTENAQQLARLTADLADDPELAREMNRAIRKRMRAARRLVTDESSKEWEEFQRQYRLSTERAQEDFERSMRRARKDFRIQMSQMNDDFRRAMMRQSEDYATAQTRQQEAFSQSMTRSAEDYDRSVDQMQKDFGKSMNRAREDMALMSEEVTGTMTEILQKAARTLDDQTSKQARSVLRTFRGLRRELSGAGEDIMMEMAAIFGFKYTPKRGGGGGGSGADHPNSGKNTYSGGGGYAEGGVLPGRSVGRDNMHFYSPEHGQLSLAGGEGIMVPEWVDAVGGPTAIKRMNQIARRGFAEGGQIPAAGSWNQHVTGYPWARWAGDINIPGSGDYGNPVRAWKDGIVAAVTALTTSYGKHIRVNHPNDTQTLYAHLSEMLVNPGDSVRRGQVIGRVGSTGRSSGPHLHFEIKGGAGPIDMGGAVSGGRLSDILRDRYRDVEEASSDVVLGGGLFPDGFWSRQINRRARAAYREAMKNRRPEIMDAPPGTGGSNQDIVREAMRSFGWHQWPALYQLVQHESSFDHLAQNPTSSAYGLFQFLDSTWKGVGGHKTSDPHLQSLYGMRYIKNRYGSPRAAWDFWQRNNWYGDGAVFSGPSTIGIGERGPEMVLPLNERGADFIADIFRRTQVGLDGRMGQVQGSTPMINHNVNTYHIDRSTTFTGEIVVQANNPGELIQQVQQRQRVMALSQAALGGRRA